MRKKIYDDRAKTAIMKQRLLKIVFKNQAFSFQHWGELGVQRDLPCTETLKTLEKYFYIHGQGGEKETVGGQKSLRMTRNTGCQEVSKGLQILWSYSTKKGE